MNGSSFIDVWLYTYDMVSFACRNGLLIDGQIGQGGSQGTTANVPSIVMLLMSLNLLVYPLADPHQGMHTYRKRQQNIVFTQYHARLYYTSS